MIHYCMQYLTRQNVLPIDLDIFISIASWLFVEETWSRYERCYIQLDLNYQWWIQGSGPGGSAPPLFVDQIEARRAEKFWIRHWLVPVFTGMATDRTRTPEQDFTKTRNEERERTREAREQKVIKPYPCQYLHCLFSLFSFCSSRARYPFSL